MTHQEYLDKRFKDCFKSGNSSIFADQGLDCIYHMIKEHFFNQPHNMIVTCEMALVSRLKAKYPHHKIILYNLEHKSTIWEGHPANCNKFWDDKYREGAANADEIWDFNIENFAYHKLIGAGDKFRFVPLRYTTWFEQYRQDITPSYDIEFEGNFDTSIRKQVLSILCSDTPECNKITFKVANTYNLETKLREKLDARFGFDFPHWDFPETFNAFRVYESICINRQPIIFDPFGVTSKEYFKDLPIYIGYLSPQSIWDATRQEPRMDVAERFKEMTYTDEAYEQYRRNIVEDFRQRTGMEVPDSVLAKIC